jgi:hypothetical protein
VLAQAATKARNAQVARQVMRFLQDQQGAFVIVVKVLGRDDRDRQDFGIADLGQRVMTMTALLQQFIDDDKDRYNPRGVHKLLLKMGLVTFIFKESSVNAN